MSILLFRASVDISDIKCLHYSEVPVMFEKSYLSFDFGIYKNNLKCIVGMHKGCSIMNLFLFSVLRNHA